eukprot:g714.t1
MCRVAISFFSCIGIVDGKAEEAGASTLYLFYDLQTRCWSSTHMAGVFGVGFPVGIALVIGYPCFTMVRMYRAHRRNKLHTFAMRFKYGQLFASFKDETWWWFGVVLVRKIVVILVTEALKPFNDPVYQAFVAAIFMFMFLLFDVLVDPHLESFDVTGFATIVDVNEDPDNPLDPTKVTYDVAMNDTFGYRTAKRVDARRLATVPKGAFKGAQAIEGKPSDPEDAHDTTQAMAEITYSNAQAANARERHVLGEVVYIATDMEKDKWVSLKVLHVVGLSVPLLTLLSGISFEFTKIVVPGSGLYYFVTGVIMFINIAFFGVYGVMMTQIQPTRTEELFAVHNTPPNVMPMEVVVQNPLARTVEYDCDDGSHLSSELTSCGEGKGDSEEESSSVRI